MDLSSIGPVFNLLFLLLSVYVIYYITQTQLVINNKNNVYNILASGGTKDEEKLRNYITLILVAIAGSLVFKESAGVLKYLTIILSTTLYLFFVGGIILTILGVFRLQEEIFELKLDIGYYRKKESDLNKMKELKAIEHKYSSIEGIIEIFSEILSFKFEQITELKPSYKFFKPSVLLLLVILLYVII